MQLLSAVRGVTSTMEYRSHYTVVWQWHTESIIKNTIHYRQAMPHNSISSALSVSTAVGLGYVTVWTWHDRTTSKPSTHIKFHTINITTECWHGGKHCCNHISDVGRFVGQNSKQLSHSTQYTHWSKTYHVMTSYINTHSAKALLGQ